MGLDPARNNKYLQISRSKYQLISDIYRYSLILIDISCFGFLLFNMKKILKILMFGWEFPPFNTGGLGVACAGLVKALSTQGIKIIFVLPKRFDNAFNASEKFSYQSPFCKFVFANPYLKVKRIDSLLSPYITSKEYQESILEFFRRDKKEGFYSPDLFGEVMRYGDEARKIALEEDFDLIHAHDWLSIPAGIKAKMITGKPLIIHVHATEFDRTGGNNDQRVYEIEKWGFLEADRIIAVSNWTKNKIIQHYGIDPKKISVVHNAVEQEEFLSVNSNIEGIKKTGKKVVLFVGRITIQKGPDYFLQTAKKVLEKNQNVVFIVTGTGDMEYRMIEMAEWLGISDNVLFTGFLRGNDLARVYQMADLYVLPSISEPFGITPLESLAYGTPVLISKQSGVSEVLSHCLKVDFWDIDEMSNKILAVLKYPELKETLQEYGTQEVKKFTWQEPAQKCVKIYNELLN